MKTKKCFKCGEEKPLTEFHGIKVIAPYCKICTSEHRKKGGDFYNNSLKKYGQKRYKKNTEYFKVKSREYQKSKTLEQTILYAVKRLDDLDPFVGMTNNPTMRINGLRADKQKRFDAESFTTILKFDDRTDAELTLAVLVTEYPFSGKTKRSMGKAALANGRHHKFAKEFDKKYKNINKKK